MSKLSLEQRGPILKFYLNFKVRFNFNPIHCRYDLNTGCWCKGFRSINPFSSPMSAWWVRSRIRLSIVWARSHQDCSDLSNWLTRLPDSRPWCMQCDNDWNSCNDMCWSLLTFHAYGFSCVWRYNVEWDIWQLMGICVPHAPFDHDQLQWLRSKSYLIVSVPYVVIQIAENFTYVLGPKSPDEQIVLCSKLRWKDLKSKVIVTLLRLVIL